MTAQQKILIAHLEKNYPHKITIIYNVADDPESGIKFQGTVEELKKFWTQNR